ncbi:MAG: hypothetical protein RL681_567 [Candidatus Parcubacteria bacterium]|jgi:adenylate cyclase class 2
MQTEIEAKFLDIDPEKIHTVLAGIGAKLVHPERPMKRKVFDYADRRLEKTGGWVRVRDEGDGKITLSFKRVVDWESVHGTKEISTEVQDFTAACDILTAIGLDTKAYQETKREKWILNNVEITIDTWPWIPPFIEIEGPTEDSVKLIARKLGFPWENAVFGSVETEYKKHYAVTDEEIDGWETITFVPVPDWLEIKRK